MTAPRRLATVLLLAVGFGVVAGVVKGDATGIRAQIGNLSAPWLLVGLLPSLRYRTLVRGLVVGLLSTLVALLGFYLTLTLVLAGHLGGGGFLRELLVEVEANRIYFLAGIVTGPVFGAIGAWLGRRHPGAVSAAVGALVAGEILAVAALQGRQLAPPPLYFVWGVDDWTAYAVESALGVLILVVALWRRRSRRLRTTLGES
jgi:hypothetical protein